MLKISANSVVFAFHIYYYYYYYVPFMYIIIQYSV